MVSSFYKIYQWTSFYKITASVIKELSPAMFSFEIPGIELIREDYSIANVDKFKQVKNS